MINKRYDTEPQLEQGAIDLLNRINKSIQHNGPGGDAREDCLNWREQALAALAVSDWDKHFISVESCHFPSSTTPHHWIELTSKYLDGKKFIWDGTKQFMLHSTIKSVKSAMKEWAGYADAAVERLLVMPETYE